MEDMAHQYDEAPADEAPLTLAEIMSVQNVAEYLSDEELASIGDTAIREHDIDDKSMSEWRTKMEAGVNLAQLVKKDRDYPFKGASNVKYPLITTAALQFNARAYPAIVPSGDMVRGKPLGQDPTGAKAAAADRVAAHMSWQLGSEIEEWEETTDELLMMLPIVGTMIRKVWYDPSYGRLRCRLIQPGDFVVNDDVTNLSDAPRAGEVLRLFPSEIKDRRRSGAFRDIDYVEAKGEDPDAVQVFIEQHRRIDLDGDGYEEPYIVTVHKETKKVARIVADFDLEDLVEGPQGIVAIQRGVYFIPYHFLPSIGGGFWGMGLGLLLGDISETANSIINMMLDAGHMASRGGGFIGSEFRIKGGSQQFKPGEWRMTGAKGVDIKNAIVPLTFPGPDATLFQLLGMLIEAGREMASVQDVMTGDAGGRQMTATTTLALIEQGMMVFTAAYKRIFRSLKKEFKLIAKVNRKTVSPEQYAQFHDAQGADLSQDYAMIGNDIEPVADPRSVTKMQETAKAQIVMQMAEQGLVDKAEASKRILQAASIPDVEELVAKPDPMQMQMMQMQMQAAQADLQIKMVDIQKAVAEIDKIRAETMETMAGVELDQAMLQLDRQKLALEALKDGIRTTLGEGSSGVAGAPRQSGVPGGADAPGGGATGGGDGSVLVGQALARARALDGAAPGGAGGGFV